MRRLLLTLAPSLIVGCQSAPPETESGVRLTVEYESTLDVRAIEVFGRFADGTLLEKSTHAVPLSVDPPGVRQVELILTITRPGLLMLNADGLARDGAILGSGEGEVTVVPAELVRASMTLSIPVTSRCGNGRLEPGEMCDDENSADGDGCSARCTIERELRHVFEIEQLEIQTTTSAAWVRIPGTSLTVTPNDPSETWAVFASGRLRSTDPAEVTAELRLVIDGQESDRLGHQTTGVTDNWAGFVTFDRIAAASAPFTVWLEHRAEVGTTETDDLRIVALRIPAAADFQYLEIDETAELSAARADLATLRFTPSFAGEYLVFGKLNQSELPSVDTVRAWLEHDSGARHPDDPNGSGYSNGRGPWAPMFLAFTQMLERREHAFTLFGASSASGNNLPNWWNPGWAHRQAISVSNTVATPAGYAVALTFDHAAMVAGGDSRADGADVRIVAQGTELDRILDPESGWNRTDTTVWFRTATPLEAGAALAYELYFGNVRAGAPPENAAEVFPLFDAFDGAELDPGRWSVLSGSASVGGGQLIVGPTSLIAQVGRYSEGTLWEVKSRLSAAVGNRMVWLAGLGENASMSWFSDDSDHHAECNGTLTHFQAVAPTEFHIWRIARDATSIYFAQGEQLIASCQDTLPVGPLQPHLGNETEVESITYDWIRIRPFVLPEPTATLGERQSLRGGGPSRWSHRKIMAFRADAFESFDYAESLAPETTTSTTFQPTVELTTAAPPIAGDFLSIQSMRISGAASADARKSGELRAGGAPLLATSHKITRTSDDPTGYHHVAGAVDLTSSSEPILYQNGFSSPDGITVRAAESVIIVLRLPR